MATINDYFNQAQLSQAAYGEGFVQGMTGGGTFSKIMFDEDKFIMRRAI